MVPVSMPTARGASEGAATGAAAVRRQVRRGCGGDGGGGCGGEAARDEGERPMSGSVSSSSPSRRNALQPSLRASLEESFRYNSVGPDGQTPLSSMRYRARSVTVDAVDRSMADGSTYEPEVLNERAVRVIRRVNNKLTGKEFGEELPVSQQVQRLIEAATSHQNLCVCFVGWCPFW